MIGFRHRWRVLIALAWVALLGFATSVAAGAPPDAASGKASKHIMEQQALRLWQTVAAKPAERTSLLKRYFSTGLRERNGEESLLETFVMLAEGLGPEMASLAPAKVLGGDREGELHYTLIDGRRVSLTLTLTDADPPLIDRFGVRPLPPDVAAVAAEQLPAAIAERMSAEFDAGRFTGAVLVARGDRVIHAQAVGMADRKAARANTLDTPINLGSINKMFTAIAIAQLQAAGKLDWQDTVGKHLPNFPNATIRDRVTIHQLLTHTSGVGSYWNEAHAARKHEIDSHQAFLETFVDQPLLFEPGQGLEYSNGGPVILGLIIEALSGSDYYDYVRERIYRPAGMMHADHFRRDDRAAGFALGYVRTEEGRWQDNRDQLSERGSAAGGGYASAHDLLAFSRALTDGRLLTRAQLETLWEIRVQPGPIGYGYLFSVGNTSGRRWVGHNGGAPGISAEFLHYPEDGLVIIVLANQDNAAMAMREWVHALVEASLFEDRGSEARGSKAH
jgi:CubicO group peptidase (beta-lactamase class C family)